MLDVSSHVEVPIARKMAARSSRRRKKGESNPVGSMGTLINSLVQIGHCSLNLPFRA